MAKWMCAVQRVARDEKLSQPITSDSILESLFRSQCSRFHSRLLGRTGLTLPFNVDFQMILILYTMASQ